MINAARDGNYTAKQREQITKNQILEKLESLRDALREHRELSGLAISDPDLARPQDPCIIIRGLGLNPDAVQLQVKMQLTGKRVVLNWIPASADLVEEFKRALTSIQQPYKIQAGGRYGAYSQTHNFRTNAGGYPRGVPQDDLPVIVQMIREARDRLLTPA